MINKNQAATAFLSLTLLLSGCATTIAPQPDGSSSSTATSDSSSTLAASGAAGQPDPGPAQQIQGPVAETGVLKDGIWVRIRSGFALQTQARPEVQEAIDWYVDHPEYLQRVQQRAQPFLFFIVETIQQRGVPSEIVLLPVVESAYQVLAYSPGRASGLWQFIPSTADQVGLKRNWWYDGRRDVVASTNAALDYLQQLNRSFDGDWELTLAAYNAGPGTVRRAIERNRREGKPTDFWSLQLPRETRRYVPQLLAISSIVADPARYQLQLLPIPDSPYFTTVDAGSQLDLAVAADLAGMDVDDVHALNPGYKRWATAPGGPHKLIMPLDKAQPFLQQLAQLAPDQRVRWTRYRIRSGDTLSQIAHRHDTSVTMLKQVNQLRSHRIRAGRHLLIPAASRDLAHYSPGADQRKAKTRRTAQGSSRVTHQVQPGDSLWTIARRNGVNHRELAKWNAMAPTDILKPGKSLVIWLASTGKTSNAPQIKVPGGKPSNTRTSIRYRVRKGDSLSRIGQRFNVSVAELRRWNPLPGKYLQPGQKLTLYVDVTQQNL